MEAQPASHRIADGSPLQVHAVGRGQGVLAAVRADAQPVLPRPEHVAHAEIGEARPIDWVFDSEVQAEIPHNLIQDDVRPQQLDPGVGIEERILPYRSARVGGAVAAPITRDIDPHIGLRSVDGMQHTSGCDCGTEAKRDHEEHNPLEAQQRPCDAPPIYAAVLFRKIRAVSGNAPLQYRGSGLVGDRGERSGDHRRLGEQEPYRESISRGPPAAHAGRLRGE